MTTKFFFESDNKEDFKILDLKIKDNNLFLKVEMNAYIELIANGYRPEIDLNQVKTFIFKDIVFNGSINMPYYLNNIYFNDKLHLVINDIDITINSNDIEIV